MEFFVSFTKMVAQLPDLLSLLLCPALLLIAGLLLAIFHARGGYFPIAVGLGGAGFFLVWCKDPSLATPYIGLYLVFAALVFLLFLIPFPAKGGRDRSNELYEKFHAPLVVPEELDLTDADAGETYDKEECGLRLAHANTLIEKLQKSELVPSDRLEVDAISRTLSGYGERDLTADELRALNDCLATVLKLTAKYKI